MAKQLITYHPHGNLKAIVAFAILRRTGPRLSALQTTGKVVLIKRYRSGAVHAPQAARPTKHAHLAIIDGGLAPGKPGTPPPQEGHDK